MSDYPEHDKLQAVKIESQAIGEFLDLNDQGIVAARWGDESVGDNPNRLYPVHGIEKILAKHFGIDLTVLEAEKRTMLESLRA
jgi:hypothetical protein